MLLIVLATIVAPVAAVKAYNSRHSRAVRIFACLSIAFALALLLLLLVGLVIGLSNGSIPGPPPDFPPARQI